MKFSTAAILIIIFTSTATTSTLAASVRIRMPKGPVKPDSYIVRLKSGANLEDHIESITRISTRSPGSEFSVTYRYEMLNGYSAHAAGTSLSRILICPEVDYVEADGIASSDSYLHHVNERDAAERDDAAVEMEDEDGPVGLEARRVNGKEVMIFLLNSGCAVNHISLKSNELDGHGRYVSRVSHGPVFGSTTHLDTDGEGTYMAGLTVGSPYSVSPRAIAISVKICSDPSVVAWADVLAGLQFAHRQFILTPDLPTIVLITASGPFNLAINDAIDRATSDGLHVVASAGNENDDASFHSPASAPGAITVGAVDCSNAKLPMSNYGEVVDVFAPGFNILSAWRGWV
ncbi:peptidase S8/S53 domain-containing protein [Cantharellus anzutake]|uniref:peptidase S8/S53 domain-containing protein n=1 Tax=Cantharellus anzutake TaxID=1750568 RepID=UPI001906BEA1|nr:peptidase S8/S53 domain-containing protein [Cantharellus anzutake]KAF8328729.1 peptidase S8/S53 domain-containing protein [Cantharellus anzutake]